MPEAIATLADAERAVEARAFQSLDAPIYELRYAALLAERAAEAISDSNDEIEIATLAVRLVARLAQELEDKWHSLHAEAAAVAAAA
jgi:hypothetical protein